MYNTKLTPMTSDLILAKMVQSKKDGRLAFIEKIEDDFVTLDMARIGLRRFHMDVVNQGFKFLIDTYDVVKALFYSQYSPRELFNPKSMYKVSCRIHDMLNHFEDISNAQVLECLKKIVDEVNEKSGL